MAGHSKWANIKHRKARQDAVKGRAWSKCSRAIMAAVKQGDPDPDTNLKLRYAIEDAKAVNMPKDTIEKAIKKASGEGSDGASFEEIRYEGYGPGGVAVIVDCLTVKYLGELLTGDDGDGFGVLVFYPFPIHILSK